MKIVTIEEHFVTPMLRDKTPPPSAVRANHLADQDRRLGHDVRAGLLDLGDLRLAAMDAAGIDLQVISLSQPGTQGFDADTAIPMARDANDRLFEAVKAHPDRFAGLAALPTAEPAESVRELERAITRLGFKGVLINGHTRGSFLDDKKYWGIFECAHALRVPIYLHPAFPHPNVMKTYFEAYPELGSASCGFTIDTGAHFLRLVFAGVFDAFPDLKIILGHLGEGLPFFMQRLNEHSYQAAARRGLKKTPAQYLKDNMVVTTSGNFFMPAFLCTFMALGADNILFSVDWPYESNRVGTAFLEKLPVSDQDKEKIAHLNAERILRL